MYSRLFILSLLAFTGTVAKAQTHADISAKHVYSSNATANLYQDRAEDAITVKNLPYNDASVEISTLEGETVKTVQIDKQTEYKILLAALLSKPYIVKIKHSGGTARQQQAKSL